jgi:uncharacterized protein (DUF427 family)
MRKCCFLSRNLNPKFLREGSSSCPILTKEQALIEIDPLKGRVMVRAGRQVIAESTSALELRETGYGPVHYVPVSDVHASFLQSSDAKSYCPYKGEAVYYDVVTPAGVIAEVAWRYRDPILCAVAVAVAGHIAFYRDRLQVDVLPIP